MFSFKSWLTVSLLLTFAPAASAQVPPPVDLGIQNLVQETEVWCWAAVAQQITLATRGPGRTPPQCEMVAVANGAHPATCCDAAGRYNGNPQCMRTGSTQQIQGLIAHYGGRASNYAPPADPATLYRTLASGRAVILQVRSGMATSHVVVLRGMSFMPSPYGVEPVLHINDPMSYFTQPVPFSRLMGMWMSAIVI